jgi:sec-independent protein translocase protein TatA
MFGLSELAVVLIVVILVIGARKLPELARSAGRSARILKAEARAVKDEDQNGPVAPRVIRGEAISRDDTPPTVPGA